MAYAKIGLNGAKLEAFESVYSEIRRELGPPALFIYLECDAKTELERIQGRGRAEEGSITLEFLGSLNTALKLSILRKQLKLEEVTTYLNSRMINLRTEILEEVEDVIIQGNLIKD